jgi:hypothetical protein
MRISKVVLAVIFAACCSLVHAEDKAISPLAVAGAWTGSDTKPNVGVFVTNITLTQNMKFSGTITINGKPFMEYSGTWDLSGSTLTWHYEHSSPPLPESLKTDVDEVSRVDSNELVLRSRLSGETHVFSKIK